jgi:hypothetical protein
VIGPLRERRREGRGWVGYHVGAFLGEPAALLPGSRRFFVSYAPSGGRRGLGLRLGRACDDVHRHGIARHDLDVEGPLERVAARLLGDGGRHGRRAEARRSGRGNRRWRSRRRCRAARRSTRRCWRRWSSLRPGCPRRRGPRPSVRPAGRREAGMPLSVPPCAWAGALAPLSRRTAAWRASLSSSALLSISGRAPPTPRAAAHAPPWPRGTAGGVEGRPSERPDGRHSCVVAIR